MYPSCRLCAFSVLRSPFSVVVIVVIVVVVVSRLLSLMSQFIRGGESAINRCKERNCAMKREY